MPRAHEEKEISLLELLKTKPQAGQRDMAEAIGLSLGMTNLLLKGLTARGWMVMRHLTPRKIQYGLTPEGLKELSSRSYRFLKRTIRGVAECRVRLESLVVEASRSGAKGLVLIGSSDVDFVLDWLCRQHGIAFKTSSSGENGWYSVYGENESSTPNILDFLDDQRWEPVP